MTPANPRPHYFAGFLPTTLTRASYFTKSPNVDPRPKCDPPLCPCGTFPLFTCVIHLSHLLVPQTCRVRPQLGVLADATPSARGLLFFLRANGCAPFRGQPTCTLIPPLSSNFARHFFLLPHSSQHLIKYVCDYAINPIFPTR